MTEFITLNQLLNSWNDFFFSNQSTLSISVLRLLTGILVLIETWVWQGKNKILLQPTGWFGYDDYKKNKKDLRFSLLNYLSPTTASLNLIFGIQFIAGLCLALGIFPNLAAFVCFVTLVSIHNRNIYVLSSGDTVYRFFCLFLIFSPSDAELSILDTKHFFRPEATGWPWTLIMIQLFMANIYAKNVLFKLKGEWWRDGSATQKVLKVRIWNRRELPKALDRTWFFKCTTYGTLVIEAALFSLIWIEEFRLFVLALGVLLHIGLWIFLRFEFFQLTMIFGLSAFITPKEYRLFLEWLSHF
ncbi:HTTM domain-containing protein [Runella sp. CRIBMP]|uniref:HTTM domain-containing protein n=1 Tax=Runella sp. CRIBMP TaxID=2683261 RepID=UPI0014131461|nr:HTTM domain-containing protein [Runella sp. CRIBMP]NBB18755.1 HTTM domain-containing protein [Runella sp. CRIBMP]